MDVPGWLPNWLEKTGYPSPSGTSRLEWAWQFLRRNTAYQLAWEQHIQADYDPSEIAELMDRKRRLKRVGRVQLDETRHFWERFRISTYPPPAPSEPTAKLGFGAIRYAQKPAKLKAYAPKISLEDNEILVLFDLTQSIEHQLDDTKELLASFTPPRKFRARVLQYQRYLRLLDAKAVGASNKVIAPVLYPTAKDFNDAKRRIGKDMGAAKRLRDHDYWRIAVGGE